MSSILTKDQAYEYRAAHPGNPRADEKVARQERDDFDRPHRYDLQAPAKNLYPSSRRCETRCRACSASIRATRRAGARSPRSPAPASTRWAGCRKASARASMSYAAPPMAAPYVTLGEEDTVTFEAEAAAQGFEDVNATATLRLLQKTMRKEETALLGGNASRRARHARRAHPEGLGNGRDPARRRPIRSSSSRSPSKASAIRSLARGVATNKTITGNDGNTYALNGGSSNRSANATQAVTLGQTLYATAAHRQRRRRLRLVRRRGRRRNSAGDHHDQQRRDLRAADFRPAGSRARLRPTLPAIRRSPSTACSPSASIPPTAPMSSRSRPERRARARSSPPRAAARSSRSTTCCSRCGTTIGCRRPCSMSTRRSRRTSPTSA